MKQLEEYKKFEAEIVSRIVEEFENHYTTEEIAEEMPISNEQCASMAHSSLDSEERVGLFNIGAYLSAMPFDADSKILTLACDLAWASLDWSSIRAQVDSKLAELISEEGQEK